MKRTFSTYAAARRVTLPIVEIKEGLNVALFNLLGQTSLTQYCASQLNLKLSRIKEWNVLVTPEGKAVHLVYEMAKQSMRPWVVLRKSLKPYMESASGIEADSITSGEQELWVDGKDRRVFEGKRVVLVDDVISTGNTMRAMRNLMDRHQAEVVTSACVFTEGTAWDVVSLGHLPIWTA